jgi:hypothetical protein
MATCKNLRRKAASQYLEEKYGIHRAPATLAKLAVIGGGPPFRRDGRIPLYSVDDLDRWATSRLGALMRSTSDDATPTLNTKPQSRDMPDNRERGGVS